MPLLLSGDDRMGVSPDPGPLRPAGSLDPCGKLAPAIGYDPGAWHDLFMMTGGASAALAGLIFVAVSVNHDQGLASKTLPLVAARTLVTLLGLVILCVLVLRRRGRRVLAGRRGPGARRPQPLRRRSPSSPAGRR